MSPARLHPARPASRGRAHRAVGLAVALALWGCGEPSRATFVPTDRDQLELRLDLDRDRVELLGAVRVVIDLFVPARLAGQVSFEPAPPPGLVVDEQRAPTRVERPIDGGTWTRFEASWRPARVGALELPALEVVAGNERAATAACTVEVTSLLDGALPQGVTVDGVEPPAPPFPAPRPFPLWPVLGAVATLAVLGWLWWRARRRRAHPSVDTVALPAHVEALRALARLRNEPRSTPADVDAFYVGVSDVLRVYLERRFGLHAPERTTEEFLPEVERSGVLDSERQRHLQRFLSACDLVKFARVVPGEPEHLDALAFAERLVQDTRGDGPAPVRAAPLEDVA
ncbi:MAG: hypothetical protein IPM29_05510 [Planctomycetes bacterium]|nr:hypothetical protein [Planctomycetota bacterium]